MEKKSPFFRNSFLKPLFIFILSLLVYLFYFFRTNPGYYSADVLTCLYRFSKTDNLLDNFNCCLPDYFDISFLYNSYILIFYLITKNLVALGLFQIALVSAINTYCWIILAKFSKVKIAWAVTLLMIFSPLNGFMTIWYQRSSLFACLVCLNLVLLYKFSKVRNFERLERIVFLINLLFISFVRIDGIVISLTSLFIYILKAKDKKRIRIGIFVGFVLMLIIYNLVPKRHNDRFFLIFPFVYQIRRIRQSVSAEFTDKDLKVLRTIVPNELLRKLWLEKKVHISPRFFGHGGQNKSKDFIFIRWCSLFIPKNFFHFIKLQAETFFDSSLLGTPHSFYFHTNRIHKKEKKYIRLKEKIDINDNPYIEFPSKIHFIQKHGHDNFLNSPSAFFVALMFGTSVPFVFMLIYFVIAFKRNRDVLIPLIPLLLYSVFIFLLQPRPKCWYWYWLVYSYYFIVFVFGWEVTLKKVNTLKNRQ